MIPLSLRMLNYEKLDYDHFYCQNIDNNSPNNTTAE